MRAYAERATRGSTTRTTTTACAANHYFGQKAAAPRRRKPEPQACSPYLSAILRRAVCGPPSQTGASHFMQKLLLPHRCDQHLRRSGIRLADRAAHANDFLRSVFALNALGRASRVDIRRGEPMLYGTLFMMAGAYTLARNGHVRGDVLYGFSAPRAQAAIDLLLYVLFFIPGTVALVWAGVDFFLDSLAQNEHSSIAADGPPLYPAKAVLPGLPVAGVFLLLQGAAEIARCVICLRCGAWPRRAGDVEEVDVEKLKADHRREPAGRHAA